jgi:hypothetical protein
MTGPLSLLLLGQLAAPPPPASPARLTLTRAAEASDCPDAPTLAARVSDVTGYEALTTDPAAAPRLSFEVQVTRGKAGYAAEIRASGSRSGTRRIADIGEDCTGLAEALAVTLAIIADDERVMPAEPIPARKTEPSEPPAGESAEPQVWRPHLTFAATLGVFEAPAVGPAAGLTLDLGRVLFGIDALWLPARSFGLGPGEAELSLVSATARVCWDAVAPPASMFGVCAELSAGMLRGSASGFSSNRDEDRLWLAPGAGLVAALPLTGRLELFGQAKLFVPLRRERFVIDNLGTVHETPPLGGLLGIGASLAIE